MVKILQGSVVTQITQTMLGELTSGCKFPTVYICQKLRKVAGSRQSYCENKQTYFFGPPYIRYAVIVVRPTLARLMFYMALATCHVVILHIDILILTITIS